ncbi:MAG: hypothetical protein HY903_13355 [Deltaproteobacteria bacterium]|nr:hypothetical protein [Deltaproteobacteria bacterium]
MTRTLAVALSFTVAACRPSPVLPPPARAPVVLVILDGVGLAAPGPGNAVTKAMAARPRGFLSRALGSAALQTIALDASGTCVGLDPDHDGNSEAGHNNLCNGDVVVHHQRFIRQLLADGGVDASAPLQDAMTRAKENGRPLHLIVPLADRSSAGDYRDALEIVRLALARGVPRLQLHGLCNGRSRHSCVEMAGELQTAMGERGGFASIAGVDHCFSRTGATAEVRACVGTMRAPRTGRERSLAEILAPVAANVEAQLGLPPQAVRGSTPLADSDDVILLPYRRDITVGILRTLRHRPRDDAPADNAGPIVTTLAALDSRRRYDDDPKLRLALPRGDGGGLLHRRLAAAGIRELRIAETDKAAHVTYFCDADDSADGPTYARFHPPAASRDLRAAPCLQSREAVARAVHALAKNEADFILMNLPNGDLLGHTGDLEATVQGLVCVDDLLGELAAAASDRGAWLFVTADHGNAEEMLVNGTPDRNHSKNPVPFIAVAPSGVEPVTLQRAATPPCVGRVTWTVLDALGLPFAPGRSLIVRPAP